MVTAEVLPLHLLYERDETAWLEAMSALVSEGRFAEIDQLNLSEYLSDMAKRDRREVTSRLGVLIAHLLKWEHQSSRRLGSWRETIEVQRQELSELLESWTLRNHAAEVLGKAYGNGIRQAVAETGLDETVFPTECPLTLDEVLSEPLEGEIAGPRRKP